MNFKIALLFSVFVSLTPLEVWSLKRIKRNSHTDAKNSRIKQDFVALHNGKLDSEEIDNKSDLKGTNLSSSNNHPSETSKKRNVSRPLAIILRERERKFNERQLEDHKVTGMPTSPPDLMVVNQAIDNNLEKTQSVMDKRSDGLGNSKEVNKYVRNKHLPHMLHTTKVVGAHVIMPPQPTYGVLNQMSSLDKLIKFGNMMMFKVGMDSLPYSTQTNYQSYFPNSPQQRNFYQQANEPNFDYVFNSIEEPQENFALVKTNRLNNKDEQATIMSNPTIFFKTPVSEREPTQIDNLMQSALDTLLYNSEKNGNEVEFKCPVHLEKKSTQHSNEDDAGVIQVCSCRFIKTDKQGSQQQK